MKRTMLVIVYAGLIAIVAGASAAQAQTAMGLKAGVTITTFTGPGADATGVGPDYRMGVAGGGYLNYALTPSLSFQPEAYFAMKGAKYDMSGDKYDFKLTYLQVPLLLVVQPPAGNTFFFAGPDLGIKLSAKASFESPAISETSDWEGIRSLDLGLTFGAGLSLAPYSLEARYTMGLSELGDESDSITSKNGCFMFLVGLGL
jgi:hypothetical protein